MKLEFKLSANGCWKGDGACRGCTDLRLASTFPWVWRCSRYSVDLQDIQVRSKRYLKL